MAGNNVDIDLRTADEVAASFGRLCRAFFDFDSEIFPSAHHISVPGVLVGVLMLDKRIGGDFLQVAFLTYLDVSLVRRIAPYSPKEVAFPAWDETTLEHPEIASLYDLAIILLAFNLAAAQDKYPPEMFIGPLLSLSGFVVDAVNRGFFLKTKEEEEAYQKARMDLAGNHGGPEKFIESLQAQLRSINEERDNRKNQLDRMVN